MDRRTFVLAGVTVLVWASAYAGIREALVGYDPAALALLRFLVSSLALGVAAPFLGIRLPRRRDVPRLFLAGFLGISFYHTALNVGETRVAAGTASLLVAFAPVVTAILSAVFLRERMTAAGWIGVGLGFAGVGAIAAGGQQPLDWQASAVLILLAAVATSVLFILEKQLFDVYPPASVTAYVVWAGTLLLLVFTPGLAREMVAAPAASTWSAVYIGVFPGALGYLLWNAALARSPAGRLASLLNLIPAFAIGIAWVWLREVPSTWALLGGVLVLAGVTLVNRRSPGRVDATGWEVAVRAANGPHGSGSTEGAGRATILTE